MTLKKLICVFYICLFVIPSKLLFGGTLTYERANQLYHNQAYTEALELYNQMIAEGLVNASVYYNAGNSYYKLNKMGWAIWCFEKAKMLQPNNVSIEENLQLAIKKTNADLRKQQETSIASKVQNILQFHQQNTWAMIALFFFLLAMLFFIIKRLKTMHPIFIAVRKICWMVFILYFTGTIGLYIFNKMYKYGIVIEDTILYNGPKEKGLHKVTKTKGIKVQIVSFTKGGALNTSKYKVKLDNGNMVWIDEAMLKKL